MKRISWPGVVAFGLVCAAAVVAAIFGPEGAWQALAGLAGGLLVRVGAVEVHSHE